MTGACSEPGCKAEVLCAYHQGRADERAEWRAVLAEVREEAARMIAEARP